MMTHPASIFVIAFTAINVLACLWLMWWTARTPVESKSDKTGHVWDGDLEEYNNPLPRWWLGLFIITVLFGAAYLIVFPGLGTREHVRVAIQLLSEDVPIERVYTHVGWTTVGGCAVEGDGGLMEV